MAFQFMSPISVALLIFAHCITLIFAADNDNVFKFLQEPTVPLLNYLRNTNISESFANLYGAENQYVSPDGSSVTLILDRSTGSVFKSKEAYMYGFFNAAIKLQAGYTAGVLTSFYLSNNEVYEGWHDEIDIEFLGRIPGEPYILQTNIYGNGTGNWVERIGREQKFHLWFDPTEDFHNYSILWSPRQILFLVDGIPIRRFPKTKRPGVIYPSKPMSVFLVDGIPIRRFPKTKSLGVISVYANIWDASSWATDGGKYKANYTYEPFLSSYTNFQTIGCHEKEKYCSEVLLDGCLVFPDLSRRQRRLLAYVKKHFMVYDYCEHSPTPECLSQPAF